MGETESGRRLPGVAVVCTLLGFNFRSGTFLSMSSYEILSEHEVVQNGQIVQLTLHYLRDGVQKSCVFEYPKSIRRSGW